MTDAAVTEQFEAERPRLIALAGRMLGNAADAEDVVQQAWLRLHATETEIERLPAWLTTVTGRLCLDRLRARAPEPVEDIDVHLARDDSDESARDPADLAALADTVGVALQVVLERLRPDERVAFVLHDSFGYPFATIAAVLDTTPAAARKLASRARAKITQPSPEDQLADWEVVDAFMDAARGGDLARLLDLLAPDAQVRADEAAVLLGTPERIDGSDAISAFFNGAAHAALAVYTGDRPAAAWFDRGVARVVFDFTLIDGKVAGITFRAAPEVLAEVVRRKDARRIER
ncbi:sigma-70 family RNA polymerase sigma factor [Millisia brevis]|uniref:sigma-70 family RNA polymerase sigma factor n=1 Tax=Millisia brevis TaxID=264148 RepID=UPI000830A121|nr:sigma-70 family RNA polymerase sigma factor [Millisia brevis]